MCQIVLYIHGEKLPLANTDLILRQRVEYQAALFIIYPFYLQLLCLSKKIENRFALRFVTQFMGKILICIVPTLTTTLLSN